MTAGGALLNVFASSRRDEVVTRTTCREGVIAELQGAQIPLDNALPYYMKRLGSPLTNWANIVPAASCRAMMHRLGRNRDTSSSCCLSAIHAPPQSCTPTSLCRSTAPQ